MRRRALLQSALGACTLGAARGGRAQGLQERPLHLLRTGDLGGLPWIELAIDGVATRWLVDSGATTALVSPALAARLKLARLPPVRVAMAGGVQTLDRHSLPALPAFGAATTAAVAVDLAGLLGPAGAALDGLLGAPWLREGATRFDFAQGRLLRSPAAAAPGASAALLPLRWEGGLPVLELALGARPAESFLFDTGNAGALVLFAQRAGALLADATALPETTVRELGGTVRARHALVERLAAPGW